LISWTVEGASIIHVYNVAEMVDEVEVTNVVKEALWRRVDQ